MLRSEKEIVMFIKERPLQRNQGLKVLRWEGGNGLLGLVSSRLCFAEVNALRFYYGQRGINSS
jgi:hypothetical protein